MKTSTFNSLVTWGAASLTVALLFLVIHVIATGLQYDGDYKVKTLRKSQQQQELETNDDR